jgi:hypothetical protein
MSKSAQYGQKKNETTTKPIDKQPKLEVKRGKTTSLKIGDDIVETVSLKQASLMEKEIERLKKDLKNTNTNINKIVRAMGKLQEDVRLIKQAFIKKDYL